MSRVTAVAPPVVFVGLLVAAWWATTAWTDIHQVLLPSPQRVAEAFRDRAGYLARSTRTTAAEVVAGYLLACLTGLLLGGLLASSRMLARASWPVLVGLDAIPKLAIAPQLVIWVGFGTTVVILVVTITCGFPIILAVHDGLSSTPADLDEMAHSYAATRWQMLVKIRLPAAAPTIATGMVIAVPVAVIGAVIGEFFGSGSGLGYAIRAAGSDTALRFAALLLLGAMSLTLFYTVRTAKRLLLSWHEATTAAGRT
jgi:NitT/TauT family transport system permease protein